MRFKDKKWHKGTSGTTEKEGEEAGGVCPHKVLMKGEKYINNNIFNAECGTKIKTLSSLGGLTLDNSGVFRALGKGPYSEHCYCRWNLMEQRVAIRKPQDPIILDGVMLAICFKKAGIVGQR